MATFFITVCDDDLNCTVINVGSNRAHFMTAENCENYFQRDATKRGANTIPFCTIEYGCHCRTFSSSGRTPAFDTRPTYGL